jgi:MFS family permease
MTDIAEPAVPPRQDAFLALASRVEARVLAITLVILLLAAAAMSGLTERAFEAELLPELSGKAATIADSIAGDLSRGVDYGIPIDRLAGVSDYFQGIIGRNEEIESIALVGADGVSIVEATAPSGVAIGGQVLVERPVVTVPDVDVRVRIGIDSTYVDQQFREVIFDILTVLLVALFVTFEIVLAVLFASVVSPMRQLASMLGRGARGDLGGVLAHRARDEIGQAVRLFDGAIVAVNERYRAAMRGAATGAAALRAVGARFSLTAEGRVRDIVATSAIDARLALFVFIFAEELQKSFLPLYVRVLDNPVTWISPEVMAGLPISVYMAVLAIATPFSGALVDRRGAKAIFLVGIVPAIAGYLGAAFAETVPHLLIARGVTAIGYAMITIACQGYIAHASSREGRARGMSVFVGTLMSASICGTAMGGIIADHVGYRAVFVVAAALCVVAAFVAWRMLKRMPVVGEGEHGRRNGGGRVRGIVTNMRFMALVAFVAVPGKIVLTGFLFLAVPTYLSGLGATEGEIGRVMMIYSIVIIFLGPTVSRIVDTRGGAVWFVTAGTIMSGAAMGVLYLWPGYWPVIGAVAVLAVGHAISIAPQIAMVPDLCAAEVRSGGLTTVLGFLRTVERAGSVVGPILVASLGLAIGFERALAVIGVGVAVVALLFLAILLPGRRAWQPSTS